MLRCCGLDTYIILNNIITIFQTPNLRKYLGKNRGFGFILKVSYQKVFIKGSNNIKVFQYGLQMLQVGNLVH